MGNKISYTREGSNKQFIIYKNNCVLETNRELVKQFYQLENEVWELIEYNKRCSLLEKKEQFLSMGDKTLIELLWLDLLGYHEEIIEEKLEINSICKYDNILDLIIKHNQNVDKFLKLLSKGLKIANEIIEKEGCLNRVEQIKD